MNATVSLCRRAQLLRFGTRLAGIGLLCAVFTTNVHAQDGDEIDSYKVRLEGNWIYSRPSGTLQGVSDKSGIDLQRDLGFNSYSTFSGKIDWKFTHKNHFYLQGIPLDSTNSRILDRAVVFQGQTFDADLAVQSSLNSLVYIFGYQYDIIRRRRGHIGIGFQVDVFDTHASISAAAQVTSSGVHEAARSASGSLLVPLPVAGPQFRLYLTNSPRLFVEGNVYGMYFFGYGNFVSAYGILGFGIARHLSATAGYQMGTRLVVNSDTSSNRIGLRMSERGPTAGLQFSF